MCASMRSHSDIAGLLLDVCNEPHCAPMKANAIAAASIMGQTQTLQFLMDAGAGTDVPDDGRCVAVICISAKGDVDTLQTLLQAGIGTDHHYPVTADALALLSAAERGHVASARVLLENGLPMHAGLAGTQALVSAAVNGHAEMVVLLLQSQAGKDVINDGGRLAIACICAASNLTESLWQAWLRRGDEPMRLQEFIRGEDL